MASNSSTSFSANVQHKKARNRRIKKEGAQILNDAYDSGITSPTSQQKVDMLERIHAIHGCEEFTLSKLESWFIRRSRKSDVQSSTTVGRSVHPRFRSLKPDALGTLTTLISGSPQPSAQLVNVWAELLKVNVEDVEGWVREEQERLAIIPTVSQQPETHSLTFGETNIPSGPSQNPLPIFVNTSPEFLNRSMQFSSNNYLSTPISITESNSQDTLSPLLDYTLPHLPGLPSDFRSGSLENSSRRPSASLSPTTSYTQNFPASLHHLTQSRAKPSRLRSPTLAELALPSPVLSSSCIAASAAFQLHTPVTPTMAQLPPSISRSFSDTHTSTPPPSPPLLSAAEPFSSSPPSSCMQRSPSLSPPPSLPLPLPLSTPRDKFLLFLNASFSSNVDRGAGEGDDAVHPATQHPKSASDFDALFAPYQTMIEDFLAKYG